MDFSFMIEYLEQIAPVFVSFIPVGFMVGVIPMLVGLAFHGIVRIYKQI